MVQVKDVKLNFFKNLFLRYKSRYLCCGLQSGKFYLVEANQKQQYFIGWLPHHSVSGTVCDALLMVSSVYKERCFMSYLKTFCMDFYRK